MSQKSTQIALGGIFSALCVTLMFFAGFLPIGSYALPLAAGAMLLPLVVELGCKPAVMVYVSVSLLCMLIVPDREAAILFAAFFGYYPIAKQKLERIPRRAIEYLCKLLLFNISAVVGFLLVVHLLGMAQALEGMGAFGRYAPLVLLGLGNIFFVIYDMALTRFYTIYIEWLRPKILRKG